MKRDRLDKMNESRQPALVDGCVNLIDSDDPEEEMVPQRRDMTLEELRKVKIEAGIAVDDIEEVYEKLQEEKQRKNSASSMPEVPSSHQSSTSTSRKDSGTVSAATSEHPATASPRYDPILTDNEFQSNGLEIPFDFSDREETLMPKKNMSSLLNPVEEANSGSLRIDDSMDIPIDNEPMNYENQASLPRSNPELNYQNKQYETLANPEELHQPTVEYKDMRMESLNITALDDKCLLKLKGKDQIYTRSDGKFMFVGVYLHLDQDGCHLCFKLKNSSSNLIEYVFNCDSEVSGWEGVKAAALIC